VINNVISCVALTFCHDASKSGMLLQVSLVSGMMLQLSDRHCTCALYDALDARNTLRWSIVRHGDDHANQVRSTLQVIAYQS
jgi:hypothetical protein